MATHIVKSERPMDTVEQVLAAINTIADDKPQAQLRFDVTIGGKVKSVRVIDG